MAPLAQFLIEEALQLRERLQSRYSPVNHAVVSPLTSPAALYSLYILLLSLFVKIDMKIVIPETQQSCQQS